MEAVNVLSLSINRVRPPSHPVYGEPSRFWGYHDALGELIGFAVRFDGPEGKQVLPCTLHDGVWAWKGFDIPRPLFNLDQLASHPDKPVVVCEGEKATEAAGGLLPDWVSITSPGGCKAAAKADWSPLKGRDVVIWPDADEPGQHYAEDVARLAKEAGARVRVAPPPKGAVKGWDAADALADGWDTEHALSFLDGSRSATRLQAITAHELLYREWPPRENLLSPWLPRQGLAMLYGMRGLGKSHFALGIAWAVATGGSFLRWSAPRPGKVLYVDGEMCGPLLHPWLSEIAGPASQIPEGLKFITPDLQPRGIPDLSTPEGQAMIEEHMEDIDLLILDNKSTLCRTGDDNAASDWQPMQEWMLTQRARGKSVLLVHHAGKNGSARGSSMIEVPLDTVIALRKPVDADPTAGLICEVHFEKARAIFGDDVKPFEVRYETRDGVAEWSMRGLEDVELQRVVALANDGLNQRDIAREMSISLGKANKLHKEGVSVGLIRRR